MKINAKFTFLFVFVFGFGFQSCLKDSCEREVTYLEYIPIYKTLGDIRQDITREDPKELENPGKIYFYNDYVFINEIRKGVHVIDNSNPSSPVNIGFIGIPGNVDIAIRDGIMYADNFIDLLSIDISDPSYPELVERTEDAFQPLYNNTETGEILVYYDTEERTEMVSCDNFNNGWRGGGNVFLTADIANFDSNSESIGGGGDGTGGSMARFTLYDDYLYMVDEYSLKVFDISTPTEPAFANTVSIGWGIETIFPYQDKLFIGSQSGMFIYDNSNPVSPTQLSAFAHATACDPVYVKDNYAYVTLRDGTPCDGYTNELDLIDISNLTNPKLVETFKMDNPHGLSIDGNSLFLCEGIYGLKTFDIEDPKKLGNHKIDHQKDLHAYDAIAVPGQENVLLVIGDDGFYQYDYSNPKNLKLISKIPVK
ncbi:MAG: hypothetical protein KDC34_13460 [Saprospiraceae bacterium]|nr:hypothetical protein [Saprospiraceae bacterium]